MNMHAYNAGTPVNLDPRTLSIVGINTDFGNIGNHWDGDFISKVEQEPNIVKIVYNRDKIRNLYKFVFAHHELRGNGIHRLHPILGDIYHFPSKYTFNWPIFIPKDFETVLKGIENGLNYLVITDLNGV